MSQEFLEHTASKAEAAGTSARGSTVIAAHHPQIREAKVTGITGQLYTIKLLTATGSDGVEVTGVRSIPPADLSIGDVVNVKQPRPNDPITIIGAAGSAQSGFLQAPTDFGYFGIRAS